MALSNAIPAGVIRRRTRAATAWKKKKKKKKKKLHIGGYI
jgi:hypothetical protein